MKITPYICSRNPARVRYTEAQASERGLYLNLKLWNRKKLLFMSTAIISIMVCAMEAKGGRRPIGSIELFIQSMLPDEVTLPNGHVLRRPENWI